jgi:hypothetical protein
MQSLPLSFGMFTITELAKKYRKDMHPNTFEKLIHKIVEEYGGLEGYYIPTHVVAEIFRKLGPPDCYWIEYKKLEKEGLV